MLLLLLMMMMMMMKVTFVMLLLLCVTMCLINITCLVVNTMVHVQVVLGLLICGVLIDGVQVHSALECHKTRWLDHVHVTVKT